MQKFLKTARGFYGNRPSEAQTQTLSLLPHPCHPTHFCPALPQGPESLANSILQQAPDPVCESPAFHPPHPHSTHRASHTSPALFTTFPGLCIKRKRGKTQKEVTWPQQLCSQPFSSSPHETACSKRAPQTQGRPPTCVREAEKALEAFPWFLSVPCLEYLGFVDVGRSRRTGRASNLAAVEGSRSSRSPHANSS